MKSERCILNDCKVYDLTLVDRIRALANENGMSLPDLEITIGLGNGTISRWKNSSPNTDKLVKVSDYFGVSIDYLLGRETSGKDIKDIEISIKKIIGTINNEERGPLFYNGYEIDDTSLELLKSTLELANRHMEILNKISLV